MAWRIIKNVFIVAFLLLHAWLMYEVGTGPNPEVLLLAP
jgi:hypothetical protein